MKLKEEFFFPTQKGDGSSYLKQKKKMINR